MSNYLCDTWEIKGTNLDELKNELKNIEKRTVVKNVPMNEVHFLSVFDAGDEYAAVPLHADSLWKKNKNNLSLPKMTTDKDVFIFNGYDQETVEEAFMNGLFLTTSKKTMGMAKIKNLVNKAEYIPVSEKAISTISNRINHFGNGFFSERLIRDLSIAKKFDKPLPVTLVMRKDEETNLQKVFAVMSKRYALIPQTFISEIIDGVIKEAEKDLGKTICSEWIVNHSVTRVFLEFPDAASDLKKEYDLMDEFIPGLMIETSDIGDCSLRMKGYYKITGCNTIAYMEDEYSRIHSGEVNKEEILKAARETIFPKYTYYPEHLASLMMIDITDETMNEKTKIKEMTKIYRKVSKEIGLVKAIGKTREKKIVDELIASINPDIDYTAYDVAMNFLTLASYVETENRAVIEAIAKTAPSVMKVNFNKEKEEELMIA